MLLSGCSNDLPQGQVPMGNGPLSADTDAHTTTGSPTGTSASTSPSASPIQSSAPRPSEAGSAPDSKVLPGVVDNPDQRNQKLVPNPAPGSGSPDPRVGTGGSGEIIDGARDSVGTGTKEDKQQAAESYIAFVNLINKKDYAGACKYVKLSPAQGTDCLAAMDRVHIGSQAYPTGLKIDRLDNAVVEGDTVTLNKLVFVYDDGKRLKDVTMFRPTDGSGKWKTLL